MSKLWAYPMPKYNFRFGLAWASKKFVGQGVNLINSVADFDTSLDFTS